ncbi:MAG: right-handed parallel beta-helix repeat-containing protein [Nanoarchaeota archaeon]|nr:right-handed parallel beta-helix repeat-containing protein [Nanoarchaeota archaeon]
MINKLLVGLCMLLIAVAPAVALELSKETCSVSRIVGESPTEMIRQMQRDTLDLSHATYYSHDNWNNKKDDILEEQFGNDVEGNMQGFDWFASYEFDDVHSSVDDFIDNELFILESEGEVNPLEAYSTEDDDVLTPNDVRQWQETFEETNPLFLFDAPYGGAYLPNFDTYVSRLVRDSTIIAPMSFSSSQFTKSFLCRIADGKSIGQAFMDARNFHYTGGSRAGQDNFISLVLMSYALYGNPRQEIMMDWHDFSSIEDYCKNNLENLAPGIEFVEMVGNQSKFRKHVVFGIPDHSIVEVGNYSVINASPAYLNIEHGELVLPVAVRTTSFPLTTAITDFNVDYVGDPVDITVEDLPSYMDGFVDRVCYEDNASYEISFEHAYTDTSHDLIAWIYPVELINCTAGEFRLFRQFNYSVDYIPLSPAMISDVDYPPSKYVNELIDIGIELLSLTITPKNASLAVFDLENNKLWEKEIMTDETEHTAQFYAPPREGVQEYSLELLVDDTTVSYYPFTIFITVLEPLADIPVTVPSSPDIDINFRSYLPDSFQLDVDYYLGQDHDIHDQGQFAKTISQGDNNHQLSFTGLTREDQSYTLTLEMDYLSERQVISYLLNTNNVPIIYASINDSLEESDLAVLEVSVVDYDEDPLTLTINDSNFIQDGNTYRWQTGYEDAGEHHVELSAYDGIVTNNRHVVFFIADNLWCGDEIGQSLTLNHDITCQGTALTISTDNVSFDCAGHSITGNGTGKGVFIDGADNVEITNCVISGFEFGLDVDSVEHSLFSNNHLSFNEFGIYDLAGTDNIYYYNNMSNNAFNAYETGFSNHWNLTDAGNYWDDYPSNQGFPTYYEVPGEGDGIDHHPIWEEISIIECGDELAEDTMLQHDLTCSGDGLLIETDNITIDCHGHSISGDSVGDDKGILVEGADGITITGCYILGFWHGIYMDSSKGSTITGNFVSSNLEAGIRLRDHSGLNTLTGNVISGNGANGIDLLQWSSNNFLADNAVSGNSINGIYVEYSMNNSFTGNNLTGNAMAGVRLSSSSSGNSFVANRMLSNLRGAYLDPGVTKNIFSYNTFDNTYNAYEDFAADGNMWNLSDEGNFWSDLADNAGYPDTYIITGHGDGIDYHPQGAGQNNPPVITSDPIEDASIAVLYEYDVEAYDPDMDELSYSLTGFPGGMVINDTTGLITWLPDIGDVGANDVSVMVSDGSLEDTQDFTVTVSPDWIDLELINFTKVFPPAPNVNDTIMFYYKIMNNGNMDADDLFFRIDIDSGQEIINDDPISVPAGNTYFGIAYWSYDVGGTHHPTYIIDYDDRYAETDEENNEGSVNVLVSGPLEKFNMPPAPGGSPLIIKRRTFMLG